MFSKTQTLNLMFLIFILVYTFMMIIDFAVYNHKHWLPTTKPCWDKIYTNYYRKLSKKLTNRHNIKENKSIQCSLMHHLKEIKRTKIICYQASWLNEMNWW